MIIWSTLTMYIAQIRSLPCEGGVFALFIVLISQPYGLRSQNNGISHSLKTGMFS